MAEITWQSIKENTSISIFFLFTLIAIFFNDFLTDILLFYFPSIDVNKLIYTSIIIGAIYLIYLIHNSKGQDELIMTLIIIILVITIIIFAIKYSISNKKSGIIPTLNQTIVEEESKIIETEIVKKLVENSCFIKTQQLSQFNEIISEIQEKIIITKGLRGIGKSTILKAKSNENNTFYIDNSEGIANQGDFNMSKIMKNFKDDTQSNNVVYLENFEIILKNQDNWHEFRNFVEKSNSKFVIVNNFESIDFENYRVVDFPIISELEIKQYLECRVIKRGIPSSNIDINLLQKYSSPSFILNDQLLDAIEKSGKKIQNRGDLINLVSDTQFEVDFLKGYKSNLDILNHKIKIISIFGTKIFKKIFQLIDSDGNPVDIDEVNHELIENFTGLHFLNKKLGFKTNLHKLLAFHLFGENKQHFQRTIWVDKLKEYELKKLNS